MYEGQPSAESFECGLRVIWSITFDSNALQQGALEIEYIEEYFGEYQRRKLASEVVDRLVHRDHQILMAEAPLPDDPSTVVPVAYKVSHERRFNETEHPTRVP